MLERVTDVPGEHLNPDTYFAAFDHACEHVVLWKLERQQTFREPGDPSWEAFVAGDWARSLRLNDDEWEFVTANAAKKAARGVESRRVRIVDRPVTPYLQWEMQYFRLLAQAGDSLRVVDAAQVRDRERVRPLPELVVLGGRVMFEVIYDEAGTLTGARRIDDSGIIRACADEVAELHTRGEPLLDYFDREIAPLPPPIV